jgi:uncharacterized membrane protein YtjA (UPF0391 family)
MFGWALGFLSLALVAALFGFGGLVAGAAGLAKVLFFVFLVLAALSVVANLSAGSTIFAIMSFLVLGALSVMANLGRGNRVT